MRPSLLILSKIRLKVSRTVLIIIFTCLLSFWIVAKSWNPFVFKMMFSRVKNDHPNHPKTFIAGGSTSFEFFAWESVCIKSTAFTWSASAYELNLKSTCFITNLNGTTRKSSNNLIFSFICKISADFLIMLGFRK